MHPLGEGITVEGKYRFYSQTAADFYSDLFPRQTAQNFLARDKELASFTTHTIGAGVSYEFDMNFSFFKRGEATAMADMILFDYSDFRDVRVTAAPGEEPLYNFDSLVTRIFFTLYY